MEGELLSATGAAPLRQQPQHPALLHEQRDTPRGRAVLRLAQFIYPREVCAEPPLPFSWLCHICSAKLPW